MIPRGWFVKRDRDRNRRVTERGAEKERKRDDRGDGKDGKEKRGKTEMQRKTVLCVTRGKKIPD